METYCSESITELAKALLQVQNEMAPATKDAVNPFIKNRYATLNSVMESCRSALITHGIWLTQLPVPAPIELGPGHIALMTKLTHAESGQWQSSLTVIPLPKADPQGMGSAITYGRRYALTAMLGMITEDDDGGEAAKLSVKQTGSPGTRTPRKQAGKSNVSAVQPPEEVSPMLPQLDGVTYQYATAQDGRQCVIATGNTHLQRELLSGAGFHWNAQRKLWWKYTNAA